MQNTALLIIDVQVAMFSYEDLVLFNAEKTLENIYTLLKKARNENIPIIFIQHTSDIWEEYAKGTPRWEIHPMLKPLPNEIVIEKTSFDAFYKTTLEETLKKLGITDLVTVGMQTEFCLDTTCRRALSLGYNNTIVHDAHSTFASLVLTGEQIVKHHNNIWGGRFGKLLATEEIDFNN